MKFTFKNISNTMSISDIERVINTAPRISASPMLKQKPLNYIEPYYRDNLMKTNNLNGVLIKLPVYNGNFITLSPEEEIIIETEDVLQIAFYEEVCESFNTSYPILECKTEDEPIPPVPITEFAINTLDAIGTYETMCYGELNFQPLVVGDRWHVTAVEGGSSEYHDLGKILVTQTSIPDGEGGYVDNPMLGEELFTLIGDAKFLNTSSEPEPIYNDGTSIWVINAVQEGGTITDMTLNFTKALPPEPIVVEMPQELPNGRVLNPTSESGSAYYNYDKSIELVEGNNYNVHFKQTFGGQTYEQDFTVKAQEWHSGDNYFTALYEEGAFRLIDNANWVYGSDEYVLTNNPDIAPQNNTSAIWCVCMQGLNVTITVTEA